MPSRPFLKFLLLYVAKRGFLDGNAGFNYAVLQAFYEYMIGAKDERTELYIQRGLRQQRKMGTQF